MDAAVDGRSTQVPPVDAALVRGWLGSLTGPLAELEDAGRIDLLRALEELKCAAEAAQAVLTAELDRSVRAQEARRGVPARRQGAGVAAQVALARRESPARGRRHVGLALVLRDELPHTMAAFRAGRVTEWRATIIARETSCLSREDRFVVDALLASDPARLEVMGDGELAARAREAAYRCDPASVVARRRRAESERTVGLRPAPDVMTHLSALLPVRDGVAVWASLSRRADELVARGDGRSRGQILADTLVERVLGTADRAAAAPTTVHLVVSDRVLLGREEGAAHLDGYGPVPADLARELAAEGSWLRRLYVAPRTGELVAADARTRRFPSGLAQLVRLRDRTCRTPWCDAPVRHTDHVRAVADGGATHLGNAQGLCEACNYAKQAPGWTARPRPGPRHRVHVVTPTGHRYSSSAPDARDGPTDATVLRLRSLARWALAA